MNADVIIGMDAGTSVLKAVVFTLEGDEINVARECHSDMGPEPPEARLVGGAARSCDLGAFPGAVPDQRLRRTRCDETGAAGAAMIAAMLQGIDTTMEDCTADWSTPLLAAAKALNAESVGICEELYPLHVRIREALAPVWGAHAALERGADG